MPTRKQAIQALIAAGLAGSTIPAAAQPFTVNGDGATLQENFLRAPAATNDFIDVDSDGQTGPAADQLAPALELVPNCATLAFGDLHLDHIRKWREDAFARDKRTAALRLSFPLWQADYQALLTDLEASGAVCSISALSSEIPGVSVGDRFDRKLIDILPESVDPFGENGEFHTLLIPPDQKGDRL